MNKERRIFTIEEVASKEQQIIKRRRQRIHPQQKNAAGSETNLIGVALSGGGIRSAVTNLGVLYEMSRVGLFRSVDYLSTVSGGGYIGCCISSLLSLTKEQHGKDKTNPQQVDDGRDIYSYSRGDNEPSLFTTDWKSFPFRDIPVSATYGCREIISQPSDDRPMRCNFSSKDQVFHLRNRASFLLPRTLLFGTHVMKAVGAITTSTFMSLLWFSSSITCICAFCMLLTFSQWNSYPATPATPHIVQKNTFIMTDVGMIGIAKEEAADSGGIFTTLIGKASHAAKKIKALLVRQSAIFNELDYLYFVAILGLIWGICAPYYMKFLRYRYSKHNIEAEDHESYISRKQLQHIAILTAFFLLILLICSLKYFCVERNTPDPRLLFLPLFCVGSLAGSFIMHCFATFSPSSWNRRFRAELAMGSGIFLYAIIFSLFFAMMPAVIIIGNKAFLAIILVCLGFILRYYYKDGVDSPPTVEEKGINVIITKLTRWAMGMLVPLFIILAVVGVGTIIRDYFLPVGGNTPTVNITGNVSFDLALLTVIFFIIAFCLSSLNFNRISPHVFYKDRLSEAFLATFMCKTAKNGQCAQHNRMELARNSIEMNLVDLHGNLENSQEEKKGKCAARGPYLLINSTLNLTAVRDLYGFRRQSTSFLFSRCFTGSDRTGYVTTDIYNPPLKLGRAMTISGAAVTSVRGAGGSMLESFGCTILGVRLGYWLQNPLAMIKDKIPRLWSARNLIYELFRYTNSRHSHIYLSDGGHCGDNLALLPLLQRNARLIIASDAECDQRHEFNSLNNSIRRAYIDHNIKISILLDGLIPDENGFTENHFTIGRIFYPHRPWQKSWLLVIKNTMTGEESSPILNYKKKSPSFPHETTADQFFSEEQFEVYRSLGREACAKIWTENIDIFNSPQWLNNPWSCIDSFCENLDRFCNPDPQDETCGINCWDDIIRAIWKSETGDFSDWLGFRQTIDSIVANYDRIEHDQTEATMVKQLFEVKNWLDGKKKKELQKLNLLHEVPRTYRYFTKIRDAK